MKLVLNEIPRRYWPTVAQLAQLATAYIPQALTMEAAVAKAAMLWVESYLHLERQKEQQDEKDQSKHTAAAKA